MHWKALFDYKHLGCQDLPRDENKKAKDIVVSILRIDKREVIGENGRKDICNVADLKGAAKPFIINKTNFATLATLFDSSEVEDMVGKPFTLYAAKVKGKAGGIVDGLRIRDTKPGTSERVMPELTPEHEKWAGAKAAIKDKKTTIDEIRKTYIVTDANEKLLTDEN